MASDSANTDVYNDYGSCRIFVCATHDTYRTSHRLNTLQCNLLQKMGLFLPDIGSGICYRSSSTLVCRGVSHRRSPFFDKIIATLNKHVTEYASFLNRPEAIPGYATLLPPLSETLVNTLGLALLISIAIIGSLYWLSPSFRSKTTFSLLVCTTLLLCITFVFPLFGIQNIIPHRWFIFEYLFLAIMAAFATIHMARRMSNNQQICLIFVLFTCLSFLMLTPTSNNLANQDSPLWLKDSTISTTYTVQELNGAETMSHYSDKIFSDSRYGTSTLGTYYGLQHVPFGSKDLSNRAGDVFMWRSYMENRPIRMFTTIEGYYKQVESNVILGPEYLKVLERMQKIYENDDVCGYYII